MILIASAESFTQLAASSSPGSSMSLFSFKEFVMLLDMLQNYNQKYNFQFSASDSNTQQTINWAIPEKHKQGVQDLTILVLLLYL